MLRVEKTGGGLVPGPIIHRFRGEISNVRLFTGGACAPIVLDMRPAVWPPSKEMIP